jgi:hypothetical protein
VCCFCVAGEDLVPEPAGEGAQAGEKARRNHRQGEDGRGSAAAAPAHVTRGGLRAAPGRAPGGVRLQ